MNNQKKVLILNTGGTFNKYYEPINGQLNVLSSNKYIKDIIKKAFKTTKKTKIKGVIFKDSLEINNDDRINLVDTINQSKENRIIIIHGTDTIDITAKFLNKHIKNKQIILCGAMKPYSIEPVEATSNFMVAYGFLQSNKNNNIYISMHGLVKKHSKIKKNRTKGVFECQ